MTEPNDDRPEKEIIEDEPIAGERKLALSSELEQIFLQARDAIFPGSGVDQRRKDLDSALAAFSVIEKALPDTPIQEIRRRLLSVQLTNTIRLQIARTCPELSLNVEDIETHHLEVTKRCARTVDETGFLQCMLQARADAIRPLLTEETCNELNRLEAEVKGFLNDDAAEGLVHVLFYCLDGELERVQAIVNAQIRSYRNVEQQLSFEAAGGDSTVTPPPVFFRQLVNFLREYGYISKFLLDNSEHPNGMEERSRNAIGTVLRHPSLTFVRRTEDEPAVDLDQILFELSTPNGIPKAEQVVNPWFQGDLKQTPFDALKVRNILRMGMSYQEKASILLAINQYALEGEETTTTLVRTQKQPKSNRKGPQATLSPEALLLGKAFLALLHPKCIVKNRSVQPEFMDIVKSLEGDERLKGDPELAQSISTLLHTKDPYLDIPIWQCRNKSIRELLMNLCFEYFDDATIRDGLPTEDGDTIRLFPLSDAEGLVVSPEVPVSRHFNTAFIGLERGFLSAAGEAMASIYSFHEIIRMAEKEAVRFFGAKEGGTLQYRFYFYLSAVEAFRDVLAQYFPKFEEGDHAIITNQEFVGVTDIFKKNYDQQRRGNHEDVQDPGLRVVSLNHEETRSPKTVDELFKDISAQIEPGKTKIILISSQTRFGDVPCAGTKKSGGRYLSQLVRRLKAEYPDIPVAIDGCQAVGRSRTDSVAKLGADIYFTSGGKALGIGNADKGARIGMVALSQRFLKKFPSIDRGHFYSRYSMTMPKANIASMMLAMHMLRSNIDLFRMEGNLGENRKYTLEQKIVRHMNGLTEYAIQQAGQYGRTFVDEELPAVAPELIQTYSDSDLTSLMGCRVHYPAHRNRRDYSGIMTVDFPNKNSRHFLPVLQAKPYKFDLGTCLFRDRALRISMHYLHEKADIDALFKALRSVHAELLEKDREMGKRLRDARYWTPH